MAGDAQRQPAGHPTDPHGLTATARPIILEASAPRRPDKEAITMIRVSVLYPHQASAKFDHAYYAQKHMPMVGSRLKEFGLIRYEIDKGVAGGAPGSPAPFMAACHLYFNAIGDFQKGMAAHGKELMADVPNYTSVTPQLQISEIVG
jgi:uncharacterized protein (TIGR02118 family)